MMLYNYIYIYMFYFHIIYFHMCNYLYLLNMFYVDQYDPIVNSLDSSELAGIQIFKKQRETNLKYLNLNLWIFWRAGHLWAVVLLSPTNRICRNAN